MALNLLNIGLTGNGVFIVLLEIVLFVRKNHVDVDKWNIL